MVIPVLYLRHYSCQNGPIFRRHVQVHNMTDFSPMGLMK
jgi:hypothetical protein